MSLNRYIVTMNHGDFLKENCRKSFGDACKRWNADLIEIKSFIGPQNVGNDSWHEKTYMDKHLPGEGLYMYYDADHAIRCDAPNIFEVMGDDSVGMLRGNNLSAGFHNTGKEEAVKGWAKRAGFDNFDIDEYSMTGCFYFRLPDHKSWFEETRKMNQELGWDQNWWISDMLTLRLGLMKSGLPMRWIPSCMSFWGGRIWDDALPATQTWVEHFSGPCNKDWLMERSVWDYPYKVENKRLTDQHVIRWRKGKPVEEGLPNSVVVECLREMAQVWRGNILDVGCGFGFSTWFGSQIAQENRTHYYATDNWDDNHFQGFERNMLDGGLWPTVHRGINPDNYEDRSFDIILAPDDQDWSRKIKDNGKIISRS